MNVTKGASLLDLPAPALIRGFLDGERTARRRSILTSVLGALVVVALTAASGWQRQPPGSVALVDVTIIDVERGTRREHQTVLIRGDRILSVGPAGEVAPPGGSRVVEGAGKFLIPGLWDMRCGTSRPSWRMVVCTIGRPSAGSPRPAVANDAV